MKLALIVLAGLLTAQAAPTPSPAPTATSTAPVYVGNPATHFTIESKPLGISPDGQARWLLVAQFLDAQNAPTKILANSDLDWKASRGFVQWQTRMRYGAPAAIVETDRDGPIDVVVHANQPKIGTVRVTTNTRDWRGSRIVAQALGPHTVQIGWFPKARSSVRIARTDGRGRHTTVTVAPGSSSYRDVSVTPGSHYRYTVIGASRRPAVLPVVTTLPKPRATDLSMASGKAMYLYWSTNPLDDNYYGKLDPQKIVDQAVKAGLHYIQLRTAYGAYWEIPPEARPTIDAIIDGLAAHHILTMGWVVPREVNFEDLGAAVRTAYYKTAKGTPLAGIAIDLERGDDFLGDDPRGLSALWKYERNLREALGPKFLIVATVEDAYLEHINESKYPFREIARYASVLNPMSYWRMMRRKPTDPAMVRILLRASYEKLHAQCACKLPIVVGGQTTAEGRNGYPPADEIVTSIAISKELGALGIIYFDWYGTQPYQWDALAATPW